MAKERIIKRLGIRDWELWGLTIGILLILALFIILTQFYWEPSDIRLSEYTANVLLLGFTALTLLFCAYIIFTEARIKKLHRETEEQIKAIKIAAEVFDGIMDIVFVIADLDGKIIRINKAVEMYGFKMNEFIGKRPEETVLLDESESPKVVRAIEEVKGRGIARNIELTAVTKDKKEFPVTINFSLMKDMKGNSIGIIVSMRDITELKRAEEERIVAMRGKIQVIDAMPDALIVLDLNGVILAVNPAYTRMFGWKPEEKVGKSFGELGESIKPGDIERFMNLPGKIAEKSHMEPVEAVIRTKDGREIPISTDYSLLKDAEGKPKNIIAVVRDITELKRLQEREKAVAVDNARVEEDKKFTRELQEKVNELEEFHDLAVGRELKMIELKNEIEELKKRLGENKK